MKWYDKFTDALLCVEKRDYRQKKLSCFGGIQPTTLVDQSLCSVTQAREPNLTGMFLPVDGVKKII